MWTAKCLIALLHRGNENNVDSNIILSALFSGKPCVCKDYQHSLSLAFIAWSWLLTVLISVSQLSKTGDVEVEESKGNLKGREGFSLFVMLLKLVSGWRWWLNQITDDWILMSKQRQCDAPDGHTGSDPQRSRQHLAPQCYNCFAITSTKVPN